MDKNRFCSEARLNYAHTRAEAAHCFDRKSFALEMLESVRPREWRAREHGTHFSDGSPLEAK